MLSDLTNAVTDFFYDFQIGEPWKLDEKKGGMIVPISRKTTRLGTRSYVVLEEVKDKVTFEDLGSIDKIRMKNSSDKPVFVRGGGVLRGVSTQSRGIQFGVIVMPDIEQAVPVRCIHASRGIIRGAAFASYGYSPFIISRAMQSEGQRETWHRVSKWTRKCNAASDRSRGSEVLMRCADSSLFSVASAAACESDNLVRTMDLFKEKVEEALRKVPGDLPDQVGMAILSEGNVVGVEAFDDPASWLALSRSVVRQYKDVLDKECLNKQPINRAELAQKIGPFLEHAKKSREEEVFHNDASRTLLLKTEGLIGECTFLHDKLIHILLTNSNAEPED